MNPREGAASSWVNVRSATSLMLAKRGQRPVVNSSWLGNANGTIAILATIIKHHRCAVIGRERDRSAVRALAKLPHSAIAYDRTITSLTSRATGLPTVVSLDKTNPLDWHSLMLVTVAELPEFARCADSLMSESERREVRLPCRSSEIG